MTARPPAETERALAFGLAAALERALEPGAAPRALRAAREAAAILSLDSLGALLVEFESRLGAPWPPELEPVRERLLRTAARCRDSGTLGPFRDAGEEWAALGGELAALEWTQMPALGRDVATLAVPRALDELPCEEADDEVRRVRLAAPVAASLRAALDWLAGSASFPRPLRLRAEASTLEVGCEGLDPNGIDAAERVLAAVDGSLGPNPRPGEAGWTVRVPAVAPRDHFLMVEQGPLRIAIPWHAVLRLQTVPANELEARARALGLPVIDPVAPLATSPHEWPVITVAYGLRRGWMIADRVVWRLAGEPCDPEPAASAAGLDRAVRTDEGEVYAVAPGRVLLGAVPASDALARAAEPHRPAAAPAAAPRTAEAAAPLPVLDAADVTPLDEPGPTGPEAPRVRQAAAALPPAPAAASPPPAAPAGPGTLRALVVEDAIATQAFLARALADRGFEVEVADRAGDLEQRIEAHPWSLVLLDVELPDAAGSAHLRAAVQRLARRPAPPAVVALVRDQHDLDAAAAAGLSEWLEKPVDEAALVRMIERLAASHRLSA